MVGAGSGGGRGMRGLGRRHVGGEGSIANGAGRSVGIRGQGGIRWGALLVLVHVHATCRGNKYDNERF